MCNLERFSKIRSQFTTVLVPWQGGFYECLLKVVKKALRKGMNCQVLYWDKLITLLVEVEAIMNICSLTYAYEEFKSNFVLAPSHF